MLSGPVRTRLFPVSPPGCGGPYPSTVPTPAPQQAFFWGWAKTSTDKPSHENTHPPQGRSQPPKMYKTIHTKAHLPATGTEPNYTRPEVHGRVHELTSTRTTENTTVPESRTHVTQHSHEHPYRPDTQPARPAGCRQQLAQSPRSVSPCQAQPGAEPPQLRGTRGSGPREPREKEKGRPGPRRTWGQSLLRGSSAAPRSQHSGPGLITH